MVETAKFYIFILVWMTLTFIQGHKEYEKASKSAPIVPRSF